MKKRIKMPRFIVAAPTCGKSTLAAQLIKEGFQVKESDDYIYDVISEIQVEEIYWPAMRDINKFCSPAFAPVFYGIRDSWLMERMNRDLMQNHDLVIFSNVWPKCGPEILDPSLTIDGKYPVGVYPDSAATISNRSADRDRKFLTEREGKRVLSDAERARLARIKERKIGIPLSLAEKWLQGYKENAGKAFAHVIVLKEDEYLSDCFILPKKSN